MCTGVVMQCLPVMTVLIDNNTQVELFYNWSFPWHFRLRQCEPMTLSASDLECQWPWVPVTLSASDLECQWPWVPVTLSASDLKSRWLWMPWRTSEGLREVKRGAARPWPQRAIPAGVQEVATTRMTRAWMGVRRAGGMQSPLLLSHTWDALRASPRRHRPGWR